MVKTKKRKLKVYDQSQGNKNKVPTIILKGDWLKEVGFDCNDEIEVVYQDNIIVIFKKPKQ